MADELKTDDNIVTPTNEGGDATVTMTQEKLDSLINAKYAKGADKATNDLLTSLGVDNIDSLKSVIQTQKEQEDASKTELEKAQSVIEDLTAKMEANNQSLAKMQEKSVINGLAAKNGIEDIDYFEYSYNQAKGIEGFNEESFIDNLKESKPYVFGKSIVTPKVDNTKNVGDPLDFSERVKNARTRADLDALYKEKGI